MQGELNARGLHGAVKRVLGFKQRRLAGFVGQSDRLQSQKDAALRVDVQVEVSGPGQFAHRGDEGLLLSVGAFLNCHCFGGGAAFCFGLSGDGVGLSKSGIGCRLSVGNLRRAQVRLGLRRILIRLHAEESG